MLTLTNFFRYIFLFLFIIDILKQAYHEALCFGLIVIYLALMNNNHKRDEKNKVNKNKPGPK